MFPNVENEFIKNVVAFLDIPLPNPENVFRVDDKFAVADVHVHLFMLRAPAIGETPEFNPPMAHRMANFGRAGS